MARLEEEVSVDQAADFGREGKETCLGRSAHNISRRRGGEGGGVLLLDSPCLSSAVSTCGEETAWELDSFSSGVVKRPLQQWSCKDTTVLKMKSFSVIMN